MVNTEAIKEKVNSRFRIEDPAPGDPGNDKGKRVGKEENITQDRVTDAAFGR